MFKQQLQLEILCKIKSRHWIFFSVRKKVWIFCFFIWALQKFRWIPISLPGLPCAEGLLVGLIVKPLFLSEILKPPLLNTALHFFSSSVVYGVYCLKHSLLQLNMLNITRSINWYIQGSIKWPGAGFSVQETDLSQQNCFCSGEECCRNRVPVFWPLKILMRQNGC